MIIYIYEVNIYQIKYFFNEKIYCTVLRNLKIIFKYILYEKENFKEKKKCLLICNLKIKKLLNKKNDGVLSYNKA